MFYSECPKNAIPVVNDFQVAIKLACNTQARGGSGMHTEVQADNSRGARTLKLMLETLEKQVEAGAEDEGGKEGKEEKRIL